MLVVEVPLVADDALCCDGARIVRIRAGAGRLGVCIDAATRCDGIGMVGGADMVASDGSEETRCSLGCGRMFESR